MKEARTVVSYFYDRELIGQGTFSTMQKIFYTLIWEEVPCIYLHVKFHLVVLIKSAYINVCNLYLNKNAYQQSHQSKNPSSIQFLINLHHITEHNTP